LAASLALLFVAVRSTGAEFGAVTEFFVRGSVGTPSSWSRTLREMMPLLLTGLGVFVALRAGLFNVGADGQLVIGGLAGATVALAWPVGGSWVAGCLAGTLAGAAWALPAAWIRAYRGGHEVISTIMLNNLARLLTLYLVKGPLTDPGQQAQTTATFAEAAQAPPIALGPVQVGVGLFLAVGAVVAFRAWERRSVAGFEQALVGSGPRAATLAGVPTKRALVASMAASGALSGLAGALLAVGHEHRFYADFSPGYGFDALGVAMLAAGSSAALVPGALIFAVLSAGTSAIQTLGVPRGVAGMALGTVLMAGAAFAGARRSRGE
jgi:simple sugar transport system permease protein